VFCANWRAVRHRDVAHASCAKRARGKSLVIEPGVASERVNIVQGMPREGARLDKERFRAAEGGQGCARSGAGYRSQCTTSPLCRRYHKGLSFQNPAGQLVAPRVFGAAAQHSRPGKQPDGSALAGKSSASVGMLSLQPQAVAAPPAPAGSAAAPAAVEGAQAAGQVDVKPSNTGEADGGAGAGYPAAQESVRKRRRTSDLISKLDSISRDIPSQTPVQVPAAE